MTRGISTATLAALEAQTAEPVFFVELGPFDNTSPQTTDRLHTSLGTITWGGNPWTGAGNLASIGEVKEGLNISPNAIKLGLSGVNSDMLDLVFSTDYYQRPCLVYLGAMSAGALVEDPSLIFSGFIVSIEMQIGGDDAITLTAESELVWFKRSRNVRYTDNQLQSEFSGDLGFEYLEQVKTRRVVWRGHSTRLGGDRAPGDLRNPGDVLF